MGTTPQWIDFIQLVANIAIVGTFFVYYFQLKAMQEQLRIATQGSNDQIRAIQQQLQLARAANMAQNLIALNQVVTEPKFRAARRTLINLRGKPLSEWSTKERQIAEKACGLWNFAAQLVLELGIPEAVVRSMRYTVVECHSAANELLIELRSTRSTDHWVHFSRLAAILQAP